jgi:uracil-DNA glycosylase
MTGTPDSLKSRLELCKRLGIRYVSIVPSMTPVAPEEGLSGKAPPTPIDESSSPAREVSEKTSGPPPAKPRWLTVSGDTIQAMELMAFDQDICQCQNCPLGKTRKNFVFGSGSPQAEIMFVGEAPGADEDAQGLPFVGRAGQLLTKIIESTKTWKRADVFICNVLKCRPPGNRTPLPEEVGQCRPYLEEQIRIIKPKLIMALGASAAQALLKTKDSVGKLRGKWHDYEGVPMRVTYHPAALLRFDGYKKDVWEDMKEMTVKYLQMKEK